MGRDDRAMFSTSRTIRMGEDAIVVMLIDESFTDNAHFNRDDCSNATAADKVNAVLGLTVVPTLNGSKVITGLPSSYDQTLIELSAYLVPSDIVTVIVEPVSLDIGVVVSATL